MPKLSVRCKSKTNTHERDAHGVSVFYFQLFWIQNNNLACRRENGHAAAEEERAVWL